MPLGNLGENLRECGCDFIGEHGRNRIFGREVSCIHQRQTDGLRTLQEFCRVLMQGGAFQPLAKDEVEIIGRLTCTGHRVVPMSLGFKDGDEVVVTEGPLLGHEGRICGIDRRKSVAYLEFDICGRHVRVRIGLAVVTAKGGEEKPGSTKQ